MAGRGNEFREHGNRNSEEQKILGNDRVDVRKHSASDLREREKTRMTSRFHQKRKVDQMVGDRESPFRDHLGATWDATFHQTLRLFTEIDSLSMSSSYHHVQDR